MPVAKQCRITGFSTANATEPIPIFLCSISWCRIRGSSGDNQARIFSLSPMPPQLFTLVTWLNEIALLNELVLKELVLLGGLLLSPAGNSDISPFSLRSENCRVDLEDLEDLEDGLLGTVVSIDTIFEAEEKRCHYSLPSLPGKHLAQLPRLEYPCAGPSSAT